MTPHLHDLGVLAPGKHRLSICVDNAPKFDLGIIVSIHSEHTQTNWNGIIGRIELQVNEAVHLSDIQVYPNAAERKVRAVIALVNDSEKAGQGQLNLEVAEPKGTRLAAKTVDATWDAKGGKVEVELPLGEQARLWDEFHPNLYELKVTLTSPSGLSDMRRVVTTPLPFNLPARPNLLHYFRPEPMPDFAEQEDD